MITYFTRSGVRELVMLEPIESELASLSSDVTVVVELSMESACCKIKQNHHLVNYKPTVICGNIYFLYLLLI